ncbi:DOPA 4,5-dioxygenase [Macrolepiota fuliginosa MF-IS2]|uniref:DOPA 4,5-dioxygenase n=1 Tax=Macrolepiota fuliginosa MF-IS2 TaxID=1400762 RepID=A0A9P5XLN0_9AGAR|nr:DOPA 4,5-dioxygenase [Macrolepiota fuliginosa MF-IS2]
MSRVSWHPEPQSDLKTVLETEIKEWHFHIYFHQNNDEEHQAALKLRDTVLRLRRDGAFVAVPLFRVNMDPMGPHPVGSYEVWCPAETFSAVFSYMCLNRGNLSVLIHPLTREHRRDHEHRIAWLGQPYALDLSKLPVYTEELPLQYAALRLGYSAPESLSIEDRLKIGNNIETILSADKDAAKAPPRDSSYGA